MKLRIYISTVAIFFKDNQLIICDDKFYSYNIYYGGILDKAVDDR